MRQVMAAACCSRSAPASSLSTLGVVRHFQNTGLMAWLRGIRGAASIPTHAACVALFDTTLGIQVVAIKSDSTFAPDWLDAIHKWRALHTLAVSSAADRSALSRQRYLAKA
jgi:hypothetical protein